MLVAKIDSFETIVTASEQEALILEATLIKKHRPRYNVILKDDKRYPSLRLDLKHPLSKPDRGTQARQRRRPIFRTVLLGPCGETDTEIYKQKLQIA